MIPSPVARWPASESAAADTPDPPSPALPSPAPPAAGVPASSLRNVIVWGNHSATQYPMSKHAMAEDGAAVDAVGARLGAAWARDVMVPAVQQRGKAVIAARGASSAASAASAVCDHVRDLLLGAAGRVVSMAVRSDGNPYGVSPGLVFSFPVVTEAGGRWRFAGGFELDDEDRAALAKSEAELLEEREAATSSG